METMEVSRMIIKKQIKVLNQTLERKRTTHLQDNMRDIEEISNGLIAREDGKYQVL